MAQGESDGLDFLGGAVAEVGDGAMFDPPLIAKRLAQQEPGIGAGAATDGRDVDVHRGYYYNHHTASLQYTCYINSDYILGAKMMYPFVYSVLP